MSRCDSTCKYPCAKDHRTKAEKIAAMRAGATTPGERAAADAAAARNPVPPQPQQRPRYGPFTYTVDDKRTYGGRVAWDYFEQNQAQEDALNEELLRRARSYKFKPGDAGFEDEVIRNHATENERIFTGADAQKIYEDILRGMVKGATMDADDIRRGKVEDR